ncbi:tyrosine/serine protein phosphatase [Microdochium trichocladiopsis]|uniref:Tyrosine/serine protein phosphatase n=1 Tax=Microdochium trichocladiopsis TaxID=1682393 RepID=A0A9P8Y8Z5_9PEZI|nr:tyrosine/serine protein phosphatase [Microdochium trichocladiopsis]KAH7033302.1 tyrosine/serine protein phosphatase [Microdochium trichocladiopsis]
MSVRFDNVLNCRDVGATVNQYTGRRIVKEGLIFRSARPDDASLKDREVLRTEIGIKTVMDLRTKTEHLKQAEKRQADRKIPALLASNAALAEPVQIPGLRYLEIKLTGRKFERYLLSQLSWLQFFKFLFLFLFGFRMQAISVIGREVMLPRGLIGLGILTMEQSGAEVAEALRAFLQPGAVPLLVHCTQGKDRTGLIIALVLTILGVPTEAVAHDYLLSNPGLEAEKEIRLAEIRAIGLTPEWGECPDGFIEEVEAYLRREYGGVEGYLDGIGFGKGERQMLIDVLGA